MTGNFHACAAKSSFFCERGGPDIQTPMAFLTAHVKEPDKDNWKKSLRKMVPLKCTKDMALTLEADDLKMM